MSKMKIVLISVVVLVVAAASFIAIYSKDIFSKDNIAAFDGGEMASFRRTYPEGFQRTCEKSAKASIENAGHTVDGALQEKITGWCNCAANYVTQNLTDDDIRLMMASFVKGDNTSPKHVTDLQTKAIQMCVQIDK